MQALFTFLIRLVLLAAGLVVAASFTVVVVLALAAWGVRYAWARLIGRPIGPFVVHIDPRGAFDRMARRSATTCAAPRELGDATDVEVKPPRG